MIKAVLLVVLGAVGALQVERWFEAARRRVSPRALTDGVLDRANQRLERDRGRSSY